MNKLETIKVGDRITYREQLIMTVTKVRQDGIEVRSGKYVAFIPQERIDSGSVYITKGEQSEERSGKTLG